MIHEDGKEYFTVDEFSKLDPRYAEAIGELLSIIRDTVADIVVVAVDQIGNDLVNELRDELRGRLHNIEQCVIGGRKEFTKETWELHVKCVELYCSSLCPCCKEVPIIANGNKLSIARGDHFYARHLNKPEETWIVCDPCNQKLRDPKFHSEHNDDFKVYQKWLRRLDAMQLGLID